MTREERMLSRFRHYFGKLVPEARMLAIAAGEPIGAMDEEAYLNLCIEKPHRRVSDPEFVGKPLGKRATRRLLRELKEEFGQ